MKIGPHLKSTSLIVPPPTGKTRQLKRPRMPRMDEATRDAAGTAIQILITAPYCEIRAPAVELQRHIPGRMCQIESHNASVLVPGLGDVFNVEPLAGRIVNPAE